MKKLVLITLSVILLFIIIVSTTSCSSRYEDRETDIKEEYWGGGYFKVIEKWSSSGSSPDNYIIYAVDTGVMYYVRYGNLTGGVTPLYNSDGTVKVYDESKK